MNLCVATPCYRSDPARATDWAAQTARALGMGRIQVVLEAHNPYIDLARENLLLAFLNTPCDALLWRDDDIECEPELVGRMIANPSTALFAPYRKRVADKIVWTSQWGPGGELLYAGLGLALIARPRLERLWNSYPALTYDREGTAQVGLFDALCLPRSEGLPRKLRDDFAFCHRLRESAPIDGASPARVVHAGLVSTYPEPA